MGPTHQCLSWARTLIEQIGAHLAGELSQGGALQSDRLQAHQPEVFGIAQHLAQLRAGEAMARWAEGQGELERGLTRAFVARTAADLIGWASPRQAALGIESTGPTPQRFMAEHLSTKSMARLGQQVLSEGDGDPGLEATHAAIKEAFDRFTEAELAPLAEQIHRSDSLLPESLLEQLKELGVFGISIPEVYGGSQVDHTTMIVATESLSRGSLGAGGSVITRPEICAKALLAGGTEQQKQAWLPAIASGERMVSVAVTEPDAGSDVAAMRTTATPTQGGYLISGEKTWCTLAGRANTLLLLARTSDEGHRGLSLFLVDKPATLAGAGDEYALEHSQPSGGHMTGRAISTIGYRGMHSFSVQLSNWFVPDDQRIGAQGRGFYLVMQGFAGGRLQTAARAIGVMSAALSAARSYAAERRVFGQSLGDMPLTQVKLAEMAARIQASRQLALDVGRQMDAGSSTLDAALVKLMSCREAEWVTREAMQLHGGMGYAEEYPVSRYWLDARVLSIFEGAEEVLATRVIGRGFLCEMLARQEQCA
jgi:(2S)-methylsuccinyl-CoA dehydrogenase